MNLTKVQVVRPKDRTSPMLAFVTIEVDGCVTLSGMRLLQSQREDEPMWLKMPTKLTKAGSYMSVFCPTDNETRLELTNAAIACYEKAVEADVNVMELALDGTEAVPEFTDLRVRKFPNNRQLRAFVTCRLDGHIALNRMGIVRDDDTDTLRLTYPTRTIVRTNTMARCYYFSDDVFWQVYEAAMDAYANAPDAPASSNGAMAQAMAKAMAKAAAEEDAAGEGEDAAS